MDCSDLCLLWQEVGVRNHRRKPLMTLNCAIVEFLHVHSESESINLVY